MKMKMKKVFLTSPEGNSRCFSQGYIRSLLCIENISFPSHCFLEGKWGSIRHGRWFGEGWKNDCWISSIFH